jgi:hypothetical protein
LAPNHVRAVKTRISFIAVTALLALLLGEVTSRAASLDEQIVNAINAGDTTNLLSLLTPEARPTEMEVRDFIREVQMLFGTLTATEKGRDMTGSQDEAVLGKELHDTTIQIAHEAKSSRATDVGLTLIYAADTNPAPRINTNALCQIRVEGKASPADINDWWVWKQQELMTQPVDTTTRRVRRIPQAPDVDKDGNIILTTDIESDERLTNSFVFSISKARFDRQPAWEPGKQPIPLATDKARQIVLGWIQKQPWSRQFKTFEPIMLELAHDRSYGCWFYFVDLTFSHQGTGVNHPGIIVLLDGSVVEPKSQ